MSLLLDKANLFRVTVGHKLGMYTKDELDALDFEVSLKESDFIMGTDSAVIKKVQEAGQSVESAVRADITPEDKKSFLKALSVPWTFGVSTLEIQLEKFNRGIQRDIQQNSQE